MGIDNDARCVIGMVLSYEEMTSIVEMITAERNDEQDEDLWSGEYFSEEFPSILLGYANPYYDCDLSERVYFVSVKVEDGITLAELAPIIQQVSAPDSDYYKFLAHFKLEQQEPCLYVLPHVW